MSDLAILVPVLNRPGNVWPLLRSIAHSTPKAHVYFLADAGDIAEISTIRVARTRYEALYGDLTISLLIDGGSYAKKINEGCQVSDEPFLFFGADDLEFQPGWFDAAKAVGTGAVGVNDMLQRARVHTTHFLVRRDYALLPCIDDSEGPLFTGYDHSFVDDEFIATAKSRGEYAYCAAARVKHNHPMNGTAQDDATYQKGREKFKHDRRLFRHRSALWT